MNSDMGNTPANKNRLTAWVGDWVPDCYRERYSGTVEVKTDIFEGVFEGAEGGFRVL
jgi:hypothetical protein